MMRGHSVWIQSAGEEVSREGEESREQQGEEEEAVEGEEAGVETAEAKREGRVQGLDVPA